MNQPSWVILDWPELESVDWASTIKLGITNSSRNLDLDVDWSSPIMAMTSSSPKTEGLNRTGFFRKGRMSQDPPHILVGAI